MLHPPGYSDGLQRLPLVRTSNFLWKCKPNTKNCTERFVCITSPCWFDNVEWSYDISTLVHRKECPLLFPIDLMQQLIMFDLRFCSSQDKEGGHHKGDW